MRRGMTRGLLGLATLMSLALSAAWAGRDAHAAGAARSMTEKQVKVRCECSQLAPATNACRDITTVQGGEIVTWYEQTYPPPNPDFDWDNYCFSKKGGHAGANVCCDRLADDAVRYFRGTPLP